MDIFKARLSQAKTFLVGPNWEKLAKEKNIAGMRDFLINGLTKEQEGAIAGGTDPRVASLEYLQNKVREASLVVMTDRNGMICRSGALARAWLDCFDYGFKSSYDDKPKNAEDDTITRLFEHGISHFGTMGTEEEKALVKQAYLDGYATCPQMDVAFTKGARMG